jgi:hypothetical protein
MIHHDVVAMALARTVELVRHRPEARDEQKEALRCLVALTTLGAVVMRRDVGGLTVDGIPVSADVPGTAALLEALERHSVAEVGIAQNALPRELFEAVVALAADAAGTTAVEKMRTSGAKTIRVMSVRTNAAAPGGGAGRGPSVTAAFDAVSIQQGIEEAELRDSPLGHALQHLDAQPYGLDALNRLGVVAEHVAAAAQAGRTEIALRAVARVADYETNAPEASQASYHIMVKRMLPADLVEQFARLAPDQRYAGDVVKVMRFLGAAGTEVLLRLLAGANTTGDGRMYMNALREMREGLHLAVEMLEHKQWFVVRNVADLLGELRVIDAVPALAKALEHPEPKVQRSAAVALAKIGTPAAALHLRRTLKDGAPALRGVVAGAIGGRASGALAMPLVLAADSEEDPALLREYFMALGRIGSREAVQALAKAAEPGGGLLRRKASGPRIAAIEGLALAGQSGAAVLEQLLNDADKDVRAAAATALEKARKAAPPV